MRPIACKVGLHSVSDYTRMSTSWIGQQTNMCPPFSSHWNFGTEL